MSREGLFPSGSRALVMVSGGQDSLALLHLLAGGSAGEAGPASLHVLHVNHHLRGSESDADEALVVRACALMGVTLTVAHRPIEKAAGNCQEAARHARREAALDVAGEWECERIALGHTADDQVETMLYRLGRYGGSGRLSGHGSLRPALGPAPAGLPPGGDGRVLSRARAASSPMTGATPIRATPAPPSGSRVLPAWEAALPGAVEAACRAAEVAAEMEELVAGVLDGAPGSGGSRGRRI